MILFSLLIVISGLIAFSISGSFSILIISRLATGIGATTLVVLAPLLITMFFNEKNMGIAMGVFNAAVPLGTVISANLFGVLGEKIYWRSIILGIAAFVGIVLVINALALFLPEKKSEGSDKSLKESSSGLLSNIKPIAPSFNLDVGKFPVIIICYLCSTILSKLWNVYTKSRLIN